MNDGLDERLGFAVSAARASSEITLDYFGRSDLDPSSKLDGSPVTIADRACETDLRKRISAAYPDDSILGEEFPRKIGSSAYEWVIDPIDGTVSFIHGVPLFGTMLACVHEGTSVLGVIVMPALGETVYAARGLGCWRLLTGSEPVKARVSMVDSLENAMVVATTLGSFTTRSQRRLYDEIDLRAKATRGWSDCYAWVLLATGRIDAVVEPVLCIWDFAAAVPIIAEAGGNWSDLGGKRSLEATGMIGTNGVLHGPLLGLIAELGAS